MITDEWNGLGVYETQDYTHWERQGYILRDGGSRSCDGVMQMSYQKVISLIYSTLRIRILPMNIDWISHILPMQRTAEHAYRQCSWK